MGRAHAQDLPILPYQTPFRNTVGQVSASLIPIPYEGCLCLEKNDAIMYSPYHAAVRRLLPVPGNTPHAGIPSRVHPGSNDNYMAARQAHHAWRAAVRGGGCLPFGLPGAHGPSWGKGVA